MTEVETKAEPEVENKENVAAEGEAEDDKKSQKSSKSVKSTPKKKKLVE